MKLSKGMRATLHRLAITHRTGARVTVDVSSARALVSRGLALEPRYGRFHLTDDALPHIDEDHYQEVLVVERYLAEQKEMTTRRAHNAAARRLNLLKGETP